MITNGGAMITEVHSDTSGYTIATREVPSGLINGANPTFTLAHTPLVGSEEVFLNGILRKPSVDYTISGLTITMIAIPETGDYVQVNYRY
jgi:hypothetical protein